MNKTFLNVAAAAAMLVGASGAHAVVYTFNASLNGTQEVLPNASMGTGTAILSYNDMGTVVTGDDTFIFSMFASGMSGSALAAHIHMAQVGVNGPVIQGLGAGNGFAFIGLPGGVLIGGGPLPAPSPTFLGTLTAGMGYVNVHTASFPGGEIRGQLIQVSAVPEPSAYAMLLAGIAALGFVARRRQR
jgi:hypothetical protein